MIKKNITQEPTPEEIKGWPINHVAKVLKNPKGYDRARDRKDKKIYDYEPDIVKEEEIPNDTQQNP